MKKILVNLINLGQNKEVCLSSETIIFEQMMLIPYIIAPSVSVISAVIVQNIFFSRNKVDPINSRSSHTTKATRTGGISIFLALSITSIYFYFFGEQHFDFSLLIPMSIMFVIGVYDDFYNADFKLKFFIQIIVAKILIDQGLVITSFYGVLGIYELPWIIAQLFTVFVFVLIVNALNFIDGIDGLALCSFISFLIFFEIISSNGITNILTIVLISSSMPLLFFNFKKKNKVFLGDAGSLLIGCIVSIYIFTLLGLDFDVNNINDDRKWLKPILALILLFHPLGDLVRIIYLRVRDKTSPFEADKRHLHHIVNEKTKNHFLTLIIILGLNTTITYAFIKIFNIL